MQLWFLLVDNGKFHDKGGQHNYMKFYQERMKSLASIEAQLPSLAKSLRKFINDSVFGEGEEEVVHPDDREQMEFTKKFNADVEEERARQKGKQGAEHRSHSSPVESDENLR